MAVSRAFPTEPKGADPFSTSAYPGIAQRESNQWEKLAIRPGLTGIARHCGRLLHAAAIEWQLRQRLKQIQYVLILGHMRSGSSMLTQVLCSHPEIAGFGETHTTYRGARDLLTAGKSVYARLRRWRVRQRYVVDKVLHTELLPEIEPLKLLPVKWMVLVRNPADAIAGMMRTFSMSREAAAAYYRARLEAMEAQVGRLAGASKIPVLLTTYEWLTSDPQRELDTISGFFRLAEELRPRYMVQKGAQSPGAGDPSDVLRAGTILPRKTADLPGCEEMLLQYESWIERMQGLCISGLNGARLDSSGSTADALPGREAGRS